jgi:hypothetical protein
MTQANAAFMQAIGDLMAPQLLRESVNDLRLSA